LLKTAVDIAIAHYPIASVWSAPSIKPINTDQITTICQNHNALVVLEEHSVLGGLGSAIAEIASQFAPVRILRVGVKDRFSHYCGTYDYLLKEHGLDRVAIEAQIREFLKAQIA